MSKEDTLQQLFKMKRGHTHDIDARIDATVQFPECEMTLQMDNNGGVLSLSFAFRAPSQCDLALAVVKARLACMNDEKVTERIHTAQKKRARRVAAKVRAS